MRFEPIPAAYKIMALGDLQKAGVGVKKIFEKQQWK